MFRDIILDIISVIWSRMKLDAHVIFGWPGGVRYYHLAGNVIKPDRTTVFGSEYMRAAGFNALHAITSKV